MTRGSNGLGFSHDLIQPQRVNREPKEAVRAEALTSSFGR